MGKTSLMLTMSQHIGNKYGNVLLVSLEERWRQILNKLISERTGYPLRLIRAGKYSDEQYGEIIYHLGGISEQRLYFVDSGDSVYNEGTTTPTIYSLATHMRSAHGLSAIFIDYLDLVDDAFGKNLYERTTYISKRLKQMAKSLDVPVFCLCQLSRQVEYRPLPTPEEMGEGRRPKMQDLRNSGALEQDADLILFLYRDDYYQEILKKACTKGLTDETWKWQICKTCDTPCGLVGKAELILAKQRQGGERDIRIPLHWNPHHFRYEGADKGQELE
jgi:replicative DNA helicase